MTVLFSPICTYIVRILHNICSPSPTIPSEGRTGIFLWLVRAWDCEGNLMVSQIMVLHVGLCILHFAGVTCKLSMDFHTLYNQSFSALGLFSLQCANLCYYSRLHGLVQLNGSTISVNNSWKHYTSNLEQ